MRTRGKRYASPTSSHEALLLLQIRSPQSYGLFISDRGGIDNIWLADADGSNRRQLTTVKDSLPTTPDWTPDGEYIVVKRHVKDTRSLGGGEIWLYHIRGGSGLQIVEKLSFTSEQNEPAVSPDGRWVYYDFTGPFDYNRDVHDGIFQVNRYDRETGEIEPVTRGPGGAVRPTPSPDGHSLAFIRRIGNKTVLMVRDLRTGSERRVFDGLDKDQMETWTLHGAYPSFAWTPDSRRIVITYDGKLWSIEVSSGKPTAIPFRATASQRITDALHFDYPIEDDSFRARLIRWPTITPDGSVLVFQAVGHRAADAYIDTEAIRLTAWQAAWRIDAGVDAAKQVAVAKFFAAEAGKRVVSSRRTSRTGSRRTCCRCPDRTSLESWSRTTRSTSFPSVSTRTSRCC